MARRNERRARYGIPQQNPKESGGIIKRMLRQVSFFFLFHSFDAGYLFLNKILIGFQDVLYLMIVNLPSEQELAAAREQLAAQPKKRMF
jgi:hypothetical protein